MPLLTARTSVAILSLFSIAVAPSERFGTEGSFCAALQPGIVGPTEQLPQELRCLVSNVYFEARHSNDAGQLAVAYIVLNRVANSKYPSTICDVVHQGGDNKRGCQFSWWCNGLEHTVRERVIWDRALRNSCRALTGEAPDPTNGSLVYHSTTTLPNWAAAWKRTAIIGGHVFYTEPDH